MKITTIGIDLAKHVFQVHGVGASGRKVLRKQLKRDQMSGFFANLPACLIGMAACGNAHYRARKLEGLGHTVRLMAPQFVNLYVKTNKNDVADAEAICEAETRSNMRFVPIKNVEQQAVLALHRVRTSAISASTFGWIVRDITMSSPSPTPMLANSMPKSGELTSSCFCTASEVRPILRRCQALARLDTALGIGLLHRIRCRDRIAASCSLENKFAYRTTRLLPTWLSHKRCATSTIIF